MTNNIREILKSRLKTVDLPIEKIKPLIFLDDKTIYIVEGSTITEEGRRIQGREITSLQLAKLMDLLSKK